MTDLPAEAVTAAAEAIERELMSGSYYDDHTASDEALARAALGAAAPHIRAAERTDFGAVTDAVNAIAAKVNLPLDLANGLFKAVAGYATGRATEAVAAERGRCAQLAESVGATYGTPCPDGVKDCVSHYRETAFADLLREAVPGA
ncbi:MAG TPA: hypothetical protein VGS19_23825 [Streptosporangiaceae bacterium]|nr:hypothetical protein [Streptosporangiaceae bacterium]